MRAAVIDADRRGASLARDTDHAGAAASLARLAGLSSWRRLTGSACRASTRDAGRTSARASRRRARRGLTLNQDLEIAVCDGVFELLPEIVFVEERVHIRRQDARSMFSLIEADSMYVLLLAKNELGFLLTLSGVLPNGHGDREHDGHDT